MLITLPHFFKVLKDYDTLKAGEIHFGVIYKDRLVIDDNNEFDLFKITKGMLKYCVNYSIDEVSVDHMFPPVIDESTYLDYLHNKISLEEIEGYPRPNNYFEYEGSLDLKLNDLYEVVKPILNNDLSFPDVVNIFDKFKEAFRFDEEIIDHINRSDLWQTDLFFENEKHLIISFISFLDNAIFNEDNYMYTAHQVIDSIKEEIDYIDGIRVNRSRLIMSYFVEQHSQEANYYMFNNIPKLLDTFKEYLDKLIQLDDKLAIQSKAYLDYEGAFFWQPNYKEAEVLLKKLYKLGDLDAANTLGYLYYYHNPNGGLPDYNKAFSYFSVAASRGHSEAIYKLSDCLLNGLGCEKSEKNAYELLKDLYQKEFKRFLKGNMIWKFADVALRLSKMHQMENLFDDKDAALRLAKREAIEAKYAIKKRMDTIDYIGDKAVYESIISNFETLGPYPKLPDKIDIDNFDFFDEITNFDVNNSDNNLKFQIKPIDEDNVSLKFYLPKIVDSYLVEEFVDYGEMILTKEIIVKGKASLDTKLTGSLSNVICFYNYDEDSIIISNNNFNISISEPIVEIPNKLKNKGPIHQIAAILFDYQKLSESMPYYYIADNLIIKPNDRVRVSNGREIVDATVYKVLNLYESELDYPLDNYRHIISVLDDNILAN